MLPNIVLIGFMGCGKSSVGRKLAQLTGHRFIDTDELIVEREGYSIPAIFDRVGERGFREIESSVLRDLVGVCGVVVATGGGIVTEPENIPLLQEIGVIGWLYADPDILFDRVSRNHRRPLLRTENPRETFDHLLASRMAVYEQVSEFRVDSSQVSHDDVARNLLEEAMRAYSRRANSDSSPMAP